MSGQISNTAALIAIMSLVLLQGCGSVYSSKNLQNIDDVRSIVYSVPASLVVFEVKEKKRESVASRPEISVNFAPQIVPDPYHTYSLDHLSSAFASDEIKIEVDDVGLLKAIDTKTEDKTADIAVALAKTLSSAFSFSFPSGAAASRTVDPAGERDLGCLKGQSLPLSVVLDPTDDTYWPSWIKPCVTVRQFQPKSARKITSRPSESCLEGICHRRPLPYIVSLKFGDVINSEQIFYFFNESPVLSYDIERAALVEKTQNLVFDHGILVSTDLKEPSSALELASLPLNLMKAILSGPAEILQLRINYNSKLENSYRHEVKALEAEKEYRDYIESENTYGKD